MRLVEETPHSNRGYECPECEFFMPLQNLYTYTPEDPSPSDADPGL